MDELFEISPSELPELEQARRLINQAEIDLRVAEELQDETGTPVPIFLRNKLHRAKARLLKEELRLIQQN